MAYQIGVIVGSLRKDSYNRQVATALIKLLPAEFTAEVIEIGQLPLYNQDLDGNQPEAVGQFHAQVSKQQAMIFVTPEYNRSMPGVLKNALDQGSRPYGKSVWGGKPAGVIGASFGAMGSSMAQQHLRNVLAFLDMPTMNQPEAYLQWFDGMVDENGEFHPKTRSFVQKWVNAYVAWVTKQLA